MDKSWCRLENQGYAVVWIAGGFIKRMLSLVDLKSTSVGGSANGMQAEIKLHCVVPHKGQFISHYFSGIIIKTQALTMFLN